MRRLLFPLIATGLLTASAAVSSAQDWTVPLGKPHVNALPDDAREVYTEAWDHIDRAGFDIGVALLNRAGSMAPDNKELQFYTMSRAINRARVYYGAASFRDIADDFHNPELRRATQPPWLIDEIFIDGTINSYTTPPWRIAEAFLDLAEACSARLGELDNLNREETVRLNNARELISNVRNTLTERDTARREAAKSIREMILRERREYFLDRAEPLDSKNFFDVEYQNLLRGVVEDEEIEIEETTEYNPFATLPGEYREPIIPPQPIQPGFGPGFGPPPMQMDEFGRPIGQPGFEPGMQQQQQPLSQPGFENDWEDF